MGMPLGIQLFYMEVKLPLQINFRNSFFPFVVFFWRLTSAPIGYPNRI